VSAFFSIVMAGLVPAKHVLPGLKDVDARHMAGHDDRHVVACV